MNDRSLCTFSGDDWQKCLSRQLTSKERQSRPCCKPKTHGPSILLPWFLLLSRSASLSSDCGAWLPCRSLPRLYLRFPANRASSICIGCSAVPNNWPFFSMTFVQTSQHMLYQSTNVECDHPVIVSAYWIGVSQRKKDTTSNIWHKDIAGHPFLGHLITGTLFPRINLFLFCITLPHLSQFITVCFGSSNWLCSRRYCTAISSLHITVLTNSAWLCIAHGSLLPTVLLSVNKLTWATYTTERHIPRTVYLSARGLQAVRHLRYEGLREVDHILERKWRGRSHIGRAPNCYTFVIFLLFLKTVFEHKCFLL